MRNPLEKSSIAQSLDGDRLTGSLQVPATNKLYNASQKWCNRLTKMLPAGASTSQTAECLSHLPSPIDVRICPTISRSGVADSPSDARPSKFCAMLHFVGRICAWTAF